MSELNCFDLIEDLDEVMRSELPLNVTYMVLGGIATGALTSYQTEIDFGSKYIYSTYDGSIPVYKPNGSARDIDILIADVLPINKAKLIKSTVDELIDHRMPVSVFGLDVHNPTITRSSARTLNAKEWLSKRTIDNNHNLRLELYPAIVDLNQKILEPWTLVTPKGDKLNVMHPGAHLLNYATRSISGIRHKDKQKLALAAKNILSYSEINDELDGGNLTELVSFAVTIDKMRAGTLSPGSHHIRPEASETDLALAKYKARALGFVETNETIVNVANSELGQKLLKVFTRTA